MQWIVFTTSPSGIAILSDLLAGLRGRNIGGENVVCDFATSGHPCRAVVAKSQKYALQLLPSGVLYDHVVPVIANGVVVDLPTLFNEIDTLERRGISCGRLRSRAWRT